MWLALASAGCGGDGDAAREALGDAPPPRRETVFDPLVGTLDRAEGVQQTLDRQAAEQRRRIAEAED
jgi:hypothetical protein